MKKRFVLTAILLAGMVLSASLEINARSRESEARLQVVKFEVNSDYVSSGEMVNIYNIAESLKSCPEMKVVVRGNGDCKTDDAGMPERRAKAVADVLTGDYGISAERVVIESVDEGFSPYGASDNGCVVVVATPIY